MNSVYVTKIIQFCKENNGTMVLNCLNGNWDVLITWENDEGTNRKAVGNANDFTRALRIAWRNVA